MGEMKQKKESTDRAGLPYPLLFWFEFGPSFRLVGPGEFGHQIPEETCGQRIHAVITQSRRDESQPQSSIIPVPDILVKNHKDKENKDGNSGSHQLSGGDSTFRKKRSGFPVGVEMSLSHHIQSSVRHYTGRVDRRWETDRGKFFVFFP